MSKKLGFEEEIKETNEEYDNLGSPLPAQKQSKNDISKSINHPKQTDN
jgi:hypothetical protein